MQSCHHCGQQRHGSWQDFTTVRIIHPNAAFALPAAPAHPAASSRRGIAGGCAPSLATCEPTEAWRWIHQAQLRQKYAPAGQQPDIFAFAEGIAGAAPLPAAFSNKSGWAGRRSLQAPFTSRHECIFVDIVKSAHTAGGFDTLQLSRYCYVEHLCLNPPDPTSPQTDQRGLVGLLRLRAHSLRHAKRAVASGGAASLLNLRASARLVLDSWRASVRLASNRPRESLDHHSARHHPEGGGPQRSCCSQIC